MRNALFSFLVFTVSSAFMPSSPASAFFLPIGPPVEEIEANAVRKLDTHRLLPFFSNTSANMVVRVNPRSDRMADPALRQAVLTLVMMATRGHADFPLEVSGVSDPLVWSGPGQTMTTYGLALEDFGGPAKDVVAISNETGLSGLEPALVSPDIEAGSLTDRRALRNVLRNMTQDLQQAGYQVDSSASLLDADGKPVKISIRPAGAVSDAQLTEFNAIKRFGGMLGISISLQQREALSELSLITTDVLLSVEGANRRTSLEPWFGAFRSLDEIDSFINALPTTLSVRQQVTSLALIDEFLVEAGYVLPIAGLPAGGDFSTSEGRQASWRPMLAEDYVKRTCEGRTFRGYGLTPMGFFHANPVHPLVVLLPEDGGTDETLAIYASVDQIDIKDRGVLLFNRAPDPGGATPRTFENWTEVPVRRAGESDFLIIEDPTPYLQLAEEFRVKGGSRSHMRYRVQGDPEHEKGRQIKPDSQGAIRTEWLQFHNFSSDVVDCVRELVASDVPLEFGPAASLD